MIYTTLARIRAHSPCAGGWAKLLSHLGKTKADDAPIGLDEILASNGLDDALWCLRSVPEESRRWRHLAVRFARTVDHLMTDHRSLTALDVAERYADGLASDADLAAARDAAWDAARDAAAAARAAAWDAAAAARAAAWDAARDAQSAIFFAALDDPALAPLGAVR